MTGPVNFNPLKLNSKPEPTKSWEVVFARDCPDGDPREVSERMLCQTKSEFQLLGRMYDKQCVKHLDTGGTPVFFGTQQSYLNMLKERGLVELIVYQRNRYQLTYLGMRVYEVNFWIDAWKRQKRQDKILVDAKTRALTSARDGWVNPKPDSDPDAIPERPIDRVEAPEQPRKRLNLDPMEVDMTEKPTEEASALPPGVYPAL